MIVFQFRSTEMSSDDCFELGRQSYANHDYYHTVLWMNEAMTRMMDEPRNRSLAFSKADILEYLAFSTYKQGKCIPCLGFYFDYLIFFERGSH